MASLVEFDGETVVQGSLRDVSKRFAAEAELRLFKRSVEASTEGIAITKSDDDEATIYVNPAFERLTGYSLDEIVGKNLRLLNEPNRDQPELELIRDALNKQKCVSIQNNQKGVLRCFEECKRNYL